jgi:hypothetical protein
MALERQDLGVKGGIDVVHWASPASLAGPRPEERTATAVDIYLTSKVALFTDLGKDVMTHRIPAPGSPLPPVPPFAEGLARVRLWAPDGTGRWLLVDVAAQRLHLMNEAVPQDSWPVSTAAAGLDARDGSGGTPPGAHRISRRIGDRAPQGMVFVSREPTGRLWPHDTDFKGRGKDCGADQAEDLILTRVLTLDGLEDGVNRGPGVDSGERYIYIHGTNAETRLGTPCSHGCVRLGNADVMALFDLVREGDPVVII